MFAAAYAMQVHDYFFLSLLSPRAFLLAFCALHSVSRFVLFAGVAVAIAIAAAAAVA